MTETPVVPVIIQRYLDELTDEARDRVITAEVFKTGGGYSPGQKGGTKTITRKKRVQLGADFKPKRVLEVEHKTVTIEDVPSSGCLIDHATGGTSQHGYGTVGSAFDRFFTDHGSNAIRAIKEYAARVNQVELAPAEREQEWEHAEASA